MRRLVLTLAVGLAGLGFAAPSFATTISTPAGAPVSGSVTVDPVVTAPADPLAGGEIDVNPGVSAEVCCLPTEVTDLLVPEESEAPDDSEKAKKDKDKDKDKG